ncbi:hypothetical protein K501DRAFT_258851 [Backusella circina FSU 941]|nr:hypothetical protein K501DRAFT_258851 [Backusella circina FSU 941]
MNIPKLGKKIFKPIILFDNKHTTTIKKEEENHEYEELIEQHRVKIKQMLDQNAQLWENEWRYYSGASEITSIEQVSPKEHIDEQKQTNFPERNNESHHYSQSSRHSSEFSSPIAISTLEPQTRNTTPPPLFHHERTFSIGNESTHSDIRDDLSTSSSSHVKRPSVSYPLEPEEDDDSNFIGEPFNPSYNPYSSKKRRRGNLPKEVTEFLKRWLILHKKHPYPTEREKQRLADETGLMVNQISNWFINARRRILQPLLESENRQIRIIRDKTIYNNYPLVDSDTTNDGQGSIDNSKYSYNHRRYYYRSDEETASHQYSGPPPWTSLSEKLPSMNVLEKDEAVFKD